MHNVNQTSHLFGFSYLLNRIFQLEGTYNNQLVQLLDHFRADQKLKHVIVVEGNKAELHEHADHTQTKHKQLLAIMG